MGLPSSMFLLGLVMNTIINNKKVCQRQLLAVLRNNGFINSIYTYSSDYVTWPKGTSRVIACILCSNKIQITSNPNSSNFDKEDHIDHLKVVHLLVKSFNKYWGNLLWS